jgi:hypothetical protein
VTRVPPTAAGATIGIEPFLMPVPIRDVEEFDEDRS